MKEAGPKTAASTDNQIPWAKLPKVKLYSGLPSYTTLKQHLTAPLVTPPWVIEPLIAEGDRTVLYGEFGSFKSYLMLHWAISLAMGTKLGPFTVTKPRKVTYVDEEMSEWQLRQRTQRLVHGLGVPLDDVDDIPLVFVSREGIPLVPLEKDGKPQPHGVARLIVLCQELGLGPGDVIFYDSLRRGLQGSEIDQQAVTEMWSAVTPFSRAGINVLLSHHMPKPGRNHTDPKYLASGSTDILAGADSAFSIQRSGTSIKVAQQKNRAAAEALPFTATLTFEGDPQTGPIVVGYAPVKGLVEMVNQADDASNATKILNSLKTQPTAATPKQIKEATGLEESSVHAALKQLTTTGQVKKLGYGKYVAYEQTANAADSKTPTP